MVTPDTATEAPSSGGVPPEVPASPTALAISACHEPLRAAWRTLSERVSKTLLPALRTGLDSHAALVEKTGLTGDAPDDWRARADAVLEYRKGVGDALLEPFAEIFEGHGPAVETLTAARDAFAALDAACRALPRTVASVWPEEAMAARPSDPLRRRLAKIPGRLLSAARKAGSERSLPLRAATVRHARRAVAPAADELAGRTASAWLEWSRRFERVWIEWADRAFPLFVRMDLPDAEEPEAAWTRLSEAAAALHSGLEALIQSSPHEACERRLGARFEELDRALEADLAVAGSFVYRADPPEGPTPELRRSARRARAVESWEDGVAARLRMYVALLGILAGATAVQRRLGWRFRERGVGPVRALPAIADELDALARGIPEGDVLTASALGELREDVDRTLDPAIDAIPEPDVIEAMVTEGSEATVEALLSMIRQAPATVRLNDEDATPPSGARAADERNLPLQDLARQSFDALRIERIRSAPLGLIDSVAKVRSDVRELPGVFAFGYEEAIRELKEAGEGSSQRAHELVGEAMHSMADSLRGQVRTLEAAVVDAERRLADEVGGGSSALLDRVVAGGVQARLLAARSLVSDLRAWINERWGPPVERAARATGRRAAALLRLASRGLRRGTELVGGVSPGTGSTRTIRRLATAHEVVDELPIVYQRLFTFEPLTDGQLLAGREGELADALERWRLWRERDGVPLIVRGRPGSGITSFLNVLGARIGEQGGSVSKVSLDARVADEASLARMLAEALGLDPPESLDDLSSAVFDVDSRDLPAVVTLDNLEHIYLRVPGGTSLIERVLTLMAETEPRVLWIGGVTTSAWQLVAAAEPTAVSQVDQLELFSLTSEALRTAITARHRRSGLPVRFQEPSHGRRLLRRRLRRIGDPATYRAMLEDDFFEQLNRTSAAHLPLALFQWLELADFESGEGVVMGVPERPDFSVLDTLDLNQNFTLKAFVEHRTLMLEEHGRIFRLPRQESYQILESLRNRSLIVPLAATDGGPERSEIEEALRYRVPSLLTGAVIAHLQGRNIVH